MSTQGGDPRGATSTVTWGRAPAWRDDFEDFYRAELPRLVALAHALCESDVADDVAQESMLAAYRRWKQVRDEHGPDAWVRRRCVRLALARPRLRLVRLRRITGLTTRSDAPSRIDDEAETFWRQVRHLPSRKAAVVALHDVLDLDVEGVAATLGGPVADVDSDLAAAHAEIDGGRLRAEAARLHLVARSVHVERCLEDLLGTRRRRTAGRVVGVLVGIALVAGTVALVGGQPGDDEAPVDPPRVGAVVTNLSGIAGTGVIRVEIDGGSDFLSALPDGTPLVSPVDLEMSPEGDALALVGDDILQVVGLGENRTSTSVPCEQCRFVDWMGYKVGILLVSSISDDGIRTSVYDNDGQERGALRLPEGIPASGYSPDRLRMVGVEEVGRGDARRSRLFVLDDHTGRRTPLRATETEPNHVIGQVGWSPDGVHLAYVESAPYDGGEAAVHTYRLKVVTLDGTSAHEVADLGRCWCIRQAGPSFAWSPDGSSLIAVVVGTEGRDESSRAVVLGVDGRVERPVVGGSPVDWGPPPP